MLQRMMDGFSSVDWASLLEKVSNDRIVALFTNPYGMAGLGILLLISMICKWRIMFVVITGALMVSLLCRYTLVGPQAGPNRALFLFAGGAVFAGAFIIYYLFIRED